MDSLAGVVLGARYRLGARLGRGGMGEVYEAVDETIGRPVAVKILADDSHFARFEREARVVARLAHPHVVAVSDFRSRAGEPAFLVMERLVGESRGELLAREKTLSPRRIAAIAMQTLSALAAAHEAGVVHRDVKPDNVFVCRTDGEEHVKLLDFGIAKPLDVTALTTIGSMVGTVRYMAPEQVLGAPVDARTDVYAMGATMHRALAGNGPFEGTTTAMLSAILTEPPPPLSGCDPGLAAIVARAMAKEPAARFQSAREMMRALAEWLAPPARPRRARPFAILAVAFASLAAGAAVFAASGRARHPVAALPPTPNPPTAIVAAPPPPAIEELALPAASAPSASVEAQKPVKHAPARVAPTEHATPPAPPAFVRPGFTSDGALVVGTKRVRVRPILQSNASGVPDDVVRSGLDRAAWMVLLQYHLFDRTPPEALPSGTVTVDFQISGTRAMHGRVRASTFADRDFSMRVAVMVGAAHFTGAPPAAAGDAVVVYAFRVE